jgi:hypothetical protein
MKSSLDKIFYMVGCVLSYHLSTCVISLLSLDDFFAVEFSQKKFSLRRIRRCLIFIIWLDRLYI